MRIVSECVDGDTIKWVTSVPFIFMVRSSTWVREKYPISTGTVWLRECYNGARIIEILVERTGTVKYYTWIRVE